MKAPDQAGRPPPAGLRRRSSRRVFCRMVLGGAVASSLPCRAVGGGNQTPWLDALVKGIKTLDRIYWSPAISIWLDRPGDDLRGHFDGRINPPWWSAANAVEFLVDVMSMTKSTDWLQPLSAMHAVHRRPAEKWPLVAAELKRRKQWKDADDSKLKARMAEKPLHKDFCNEYLDDSGWWGIAWLKMARFNKNAGMLETAKLVHAHMARNWQPEPDGGIAWGEEPDKRKPNAITNGLFLILSSRLAQDAKDPKYRQWAEKTLAWFRDKKLNDGEGIVDRPGGMRDWWSYNQGVYIGGLLAFADLTGRAEFTEEAVQLAGSVLKTGHFVSADLILVEMMGTSGWDGCLFKGILARCLAQLQAGLRRRKTHVEIRERIELCLTATANAIVKSMGEDGQFPAEWHAGAKNQERNFNTHLSALMTLAAACAISSV